MNKKMIALMALVASSAYAGSGCSTGTCDKTSAAVTISAEEAAFVSKLSENHCLAFNLMNAEQRHEVLVVAHKDAVAPDAAVDAVLNKHHLAVVEGALKSTNAQ